MRQDLDAKLDGKGLRPGVFDPGISGDEWDRDDSDLVLVAVAAIVRQPGVRPFYTQRTVWSWREDCRSVQCFV